MIELAWRTPPEWAQRVSGEPHALLSDHAHCELRAASAASTILTKNPELPLLVDRLAGVASEELRHFRRVVKALRALGGELGASYKNPYVDGLNKRSYPTRGAVLLDRLLVAALVEARSLERFELLAEHASDERLRELYARLVPSERAHAGLYVDLACGAYPEALVQRRLGILIEHEAAVLDELPYEVRMHSGLR